MDLTQYHCAPERSLIIVTILYTTALTVSTSVQNALMQKSTCDPLIPFGECLVGEYEGRRRLYSNTTYLQYSISFIVVLLAGMYEFNKIIKNGQLGYTQWVANARGSQNKISTNYTMYSIISYYCSHALKSEPGSYNILLC